MNRPIVWSIAGSDSSGGAGIQADVKAIHALGGHPCTVVTALTAQNTRGVSDIQWTSAALLRAQLLALSQDLPARAIKIGMLGQEETIRQTRDALIDIDAFKVLDPVLVSTSGAPLFEPSSVDELRSLFPLVDLVTPNRCEAEILARMSIQTCEDMEQAARALLGAGCNAVLVKGGDLGGPCSQDYFASKTDAFWLSAPRQGQNNFHGTGCTLSSTIATGVALGLDLVSAIVNAKHHIGESLAQSLAIGQGAWPVQQSGWPRGAAAFPALSSCSAPRSIQFRAWQNEAIGFYPIVDRVDLVVDLIKLGARLIQIRIKPNRSGADAEIAEAIEFSKANDVRLIVNDHWKIALKHSAFGVHLGQDDLENVDWEHLSKSDLFLGISTHSHAELARALQYGPSYVSIGTLFETKSKKLLHPPLGLDLFEKIAACSPVPVVAIGGISLNNAVQALAAGASGVALISDIRREMNLCNESARRWINFDKNLRQAI